VLSSTYLVRPIAEIHKGLVFIFDVDGVVVDSNAVHAACWLEYLRSNGIEPPAGFAASMFGKRNDDILRALLGEEPSDEEIFRHGAAKEALYRERMRPVLREHLVPGLIEFLDRHPEVPKGVASNAEPANVEFVLRDAGIRHYFQAVIDGHQVSKPKPDPEIYLKAARCLNTPPADCIVFEDSVAGVNAARAAGTRIVGLTTTHADLPHLDLEIRDFREPELEQWLLRQKPRG
jgi:beta-phosphoglucomutase